VVWGDTRNAGYSLLWGDSVLWGDSLLWGDSGNLFTQSVLGNGDR